jgi:hypothetical protein
MQVMRLGQVAFVLGGLVGLALVSCNPVTQPRNPFLGYTEEYGVAGQQQTFEGGAAGAVGAEETFRRPLTLTFINSHPDAVVDTSFVAWVEVSSVRSAGQQDALLRGGYAQLTKEARLGSAYTLPVGTFVLKGPGTAGATPVTLSRAGSTSATQGGAQTVTPTTLAFDMITPDKVLVFSQPPVSCDSVAFTFSDPITGEVLSGSSPAGGGYKTLAQVDVYQCSPLRPGLFFTAVGGTRLPNEFREGDSLTFTFQPTPTAGAAFAVVTISTPQTTTVQP